MIKIVADAGPVIHLHEADLLPLLRNCGQLYLPLLVSGEINTALGSDFQLPNWIHVERLDRKDKKEAEFLQELGEMHGGESEAFILARKINANWLLTDDAEARLFASRFDMEVHGSLGVVLWNLAYSHINGKKALKSLDKLKMSSLWLSEKIYSEAIDAVKEICSNRQENI